MGSDSLWIREFDSLAGPGIGSGIWNWTAGWILELDPGATTRLLESEAGNKIV